jgi:hypothetical protein
LPCFAGRLILVCLKFYSGNVISFTWIRLEKRQFPIASILNSDILGPASRKAVISKFQPFLKEGKLRSAGRGMGQVRIHFAGNVY